MEKRLVKVGVLFRNDAPGGLGFEITDKNGQLEISIRDGIASYEKVWKESSEEEQMDLVKTYIKQLEYVARVKIENVEYSHLHVCLVNMAFLQRMGIVEGDNYNGCVFSYE